MKTTNIVLKASSITLLAGLGLAGCVAVPAYGPDAYGPPAYGPAVYAAPVVVVPTIRFGVGYRDGGHRYYRGRHRR